MRPAAYQFDARLATVRACAATQIYLQGHHLEDNSGQGQDYGQDAAPVVGYKLHQSAAPTNHTYSAR